MEIRLLPEIEEELVIAARTGRLVPFIGAGVSRLAGAPSWNDFADDAIKFFVKLGKFNLSQFEQIKHLSPRIKLSIALSLQETHQIKINFEEILQTTDSSKKEVGAKLYGHLSKLSSTFVTTNYDRWLDEGYSVSDLAAESDSSAGTLLTPRKSIYKPQDFTHDKLDTSNTVIHLHGSLADADKMILTTKDYLKHYANDRRKEESDSENVVLTFLENLFKIKNVLFIGYGLEELEILEYIIQKAKGSSTEEDAANPRHFMLQGFFTHELELAQSLQNYYLREYGVKLLPFSKDQKDHTQLIDVIEFLSKEIPASALTIQELQEMEALLNG